MKIVVSINNKEEICGDQILISIHELDKIDNATCTEVVLKACIDYVPHNMREQLFIVALSKLRCGGKIIIHGTDIYNLINAFSKKNTDLEKLNILLFNGRMSCGSINEVKAYIQKYNLELEEISVQYNTYTITAKRKYE